jgi:hypothetical protein
MVNYQYKQGGSMHIDKAKKRIAKQVNKGFRGFPLIAIEYFGNTANVATEVVVQFTLEEESQAQEERFASQGDARENETIQTSLVKIIERAGANSVTQVSGVTLIK